MACARADGDSIRDDKEIEKVLDEFLITSIAFYLKGISQLAVDGIAVHTFYRVICLVIVENCFSSSMDFI
jgi:hypothetical protein